MSRKPCKRIGGAPFSLGGHPRADLLDRGEFSPRLFATAPRPVVRVKVVAYQPRVATSPKASGTNSLDAAANIALGARLRSESAVSTPYEVRAARYVQRLAGLPGASGALTAREASSSSRALPMDPAVSADPRSPRGGPAGGTASVPGAAAGPLEWALVQELDIVDHLSKENARRQQELQRNKDHVRELQVEEARRSNKAKDERFQTQKKSRADVDADVEAWKREEALKKEHALARRRSVDRDMQRQLKEAQRQQELRREKERELEHQMMAAAQAKEREQQEWEDKKRAKEKAAAVQIREDLAASLELRKQRKREEKEADVQSAKLAAELVAAKERSRLEQAEAFRVKQQQLADRYEQGSAGQELARKEREDAERAARYQRNALEKDRLRAEAKKQQASNQRVASREAVRVQLEERDRERRAGREEEAQHAERVRQDTEAAEAKDKVAKERRRQANREHAEYLQGQIRENDAAEHPRVARDRMNEAERKYNNDKLKRALDAERPDGLHFLLQHKRQEYGLPATAR